MPEPKNRHLPIKTLLLGSVFAGLIYFFHPEVGRVSLLVDGQPVADPLFRLAAVPILLVVTGLIAALALIALFGMGMMIFFAVLGFSAIGILLLAPYSWPILLLFCLMLLAMSWHGKEDEGG
ncbi:hypothetical protein PL263_07515 [Methylomonas sp. EFPC3]|uniref:hypothetical protein n=1 Tax=Methylomonas sp. EFPC3 TaxID=3021710 RepID=UPI0024166277|nr:hypothetical protein [Methylomonas sp. EFPC3]WFP51870.1 hypothetical protein PL263_07515 [Methylomonas sp. EFPC3]